MAVIDNRVYSIVREAILIVRGLGFDTGKVTIEISNKLRTTWAYCQETGEGENRLVFGYDVVNKASNEGLLKIAVHEVIHTIDGCYDHGDKFMKVGNMIYKKHGIVVTECYEKEDLGIVDKYIPRRFR